MDMIQRVSSLSYLPMLPRLTGRLLNMSYHFLQRLTVELMLSSVKTVRTDRDLCVGLTGFLSCPEYTEFIHPLSPILLHMSGPSTAQADGQRMAQPSIQVIATTTTLQ